MLGDLHDGPDTASSASSFPFEALSLFKTPTQWCDKLVFKKRETFRFPGCKSLTMAPILWLCLIRTHRTPENFTASFHFLTLHDFPADDSPLLYRGNRGHQVGASTIFWPSKGKFTFAHLSLPSLQVLPVPPPPFLDSTASHLFRKSIPSVLLSPSCLLGYTQGRVSTTLRKTEARTINILNTM